MLKRMLTGALCAGLLAGLLAAALQSLFVQQYIVLAERYESGELVHGQRSDAVAEPANAAAPAAGQTAVAGNAAPAHGAPDVRDGGSVLARNGLTAGFAALIYTAYGLLMMAGFALAEQFGRPVTRREGLLWGLAGFAAFQMLPALGLAPTLPGTVSADIGARQIWWWGTALSAVGALALIGYGRGPLAWGVALILLAVPHLVGAPMLGTFNGTAPPEVAGAFAAGTLAVGLAAWTVLGWTGGWFWSRGTA